MTSFLRKFIVGQAKGEREERREKRDPLFLILLSTLMSSTLEVQEHDSFTAKDISRFLSLSFTFVYCSVFLCSCRLSVILWWEKKRNNFKLLFKYTYTGLVLFSFSPPSSSSIPSTCRDDDRQRRGRSETAYEVKQIFRFFFLFSFILNSLFWTISAPMHSAYIYFGLYLGDLKMRTNTIVCAIFSNMKCVNGGDRNKT